MNESVDRFVVKKNDTIRHCMEVLDATSKAIVLVCAEERRLLGTVTDGDVRRGVLKGIELTNSVEGIMNTSPLTVPQGTSSRAVLDLMRRYVIHQIPVVDKRNCVLHMEFLDDLIPSEDLPNCAVIMAGGYGKRLHPLSRKTPKPLLNVGKRPVLETIICQLKWHRIVNIYIAVHHLGHRIEQYFGDGSRYEVNIEYVYERDKMGTAGALGLLPAYRFSQPFVVMNGDILTKLDFRSMISYHVQNRYEITVAGMEYTVEVPYGVLNLDHNTEVSKIDEKPKFRNFVNAGIYVLSPGCLELVSRSERLDMPDLVSRAISQKRTVGSFPLREYWIDIGQFRDFYKANREYEEHFK